MQSTSQTSPNGKIDEPSGDLNVTIMRCNVATLAVLRESIDYLIDIRSELRKLNETLELARPLLDNPATRFAAARRARRG